MRALVHYNNWICGLSEDGRRPEVVLPTSIHTRGQVVSGWFKRDPRPIPPNPHPVFRIGINPRESCPLSCDFCVNELDNEYSFNTDPRSLAAMIQAVVKYDQRPWVNWLIGESMSLGGFKFADEFRYYAFKYGVETKFKLNINTNAVWMIGRNVPEDWYEDFANKTLYWSYALEPQSKASHIHAGQKVQTRTVARKLMALRQKGWKVCINVFLPSHRYVKYGEECVQDTLELLQSNQWDGVNLAYIWHMDDFEEKHSKPAWAFNVENFASLMFKHDALPPRTVEPFATGSNNRRINYDGSGGWIFPDGSRQIPAAYDGLMPPVYDPTPIENACRQCPSVFSCKVIRDAGLQKDGVVLARHRGGFENAFSSTILRALTTIKETAAKANMSDLVTYQHDGDEYVRQLRDDSCYRIHV